MFIDKPLHYHKYLTLSKKNRIKLRFAIIDIEYYLLSRKDNKNDKLKTYIYRQTTILSQVLNTKQKDKTKLNSLVIVSIKYKLQIIGKNVQYTGYTLSRNNKNK